MSEEEAERQLETGEVTAAIVVPRGVRLRAARHGRAARCSSCGPVGGGLASRFELQTEALVFRLNRLLQEAYIEANLKYVTLLVEGGEADFLGEEFDVVGPRGSGPPARAAARPHGRPRGARGDRGARDVRAPGAPGARADRRDASRHRQPHRARGREREAGRTWLLSAQLQAYALALTLSLRRRCSWRRRAIAAERDENVVGRLVRGLVGLRELVTAKVLLGATIALALAARARDRLRSGGRDRRGRRRPAVEPPAAACARALPRGRGLRRVRRAPGGARPRVASGRAGRVPRHASARAHRHRPLGVGRGRRLDLDCASRSCTRSTSSKRRSSPSTRGARSASRACGSSGSPQRSRRPRGWACEDS